MTWLSRFVVPINKKANRKPWQIVHIISVIAKIMTYGSVMKAPVNDINTLDKNTLCDNRLD